jgi:hypothetical protein
LQRPKYGTISLTRIIHEGCERATFEAVGNGIAGIGSEEDQSPGLGLLQLLDQPLERRQGPMGGEGVARGAESPPKESRCSVEDEDRMIHMLFVISVEEAELLLAVGGVIGGFHVVDDHLPGAGMGFEVQIHQIGTLRGLAGHDLGSRVLRSSENRQTEAERRWQGQGGGSRGNPGRKAQVCRHAAGALSQQRRNSILGTAAPGDRSGDQDRWLDASPRLRHEWLVPGSGKEAPKVLPWVIP